jgi:hypothetical protein
MIISHAPLESDAITMQIPGECDKVSLTPNSPADIAFADEYEKGSIPSAQ